MLSIDPAPCGFARPRNPQIASTTANPPIAYSRIFAGGSLRSGVAMSCVTFTPTPGPRSSPGFFAGGAGAGGNGCAEGVEGVAEAAVCGLGVSSGMDRSRSKFYASSINPRQHYPRSSQPTRPRAANYKDPKSPGYFACRVLISNSNSGIFFRFSRHG